VDQQEREARIRRIADRMTERLQREWPDGKASINELEDLAERLGREVMREVTTEVLRDQSQQRQGNQSACACGQQAFYRGQYPLKVVTASGRVRLRRAYYYCAHCGKGHCPLDREWGLGSANTTPRVQDIAAGLAALVAYVQVPAVLQRVRLPLHLGVKTIEEITQAVGERIANHGPLGPAHSGRAIAVAADGVMVPTYAGNREARCGVVYEPEWNPARTPAAEAELRKEYVGTLTSREQLMEELCQRAQRRRPNPWTLVAALGDGACWIWEGYALHLPNRVEILDFYHVMEHVTVVAAAQYGDSTDLAAAWRERIRKNLQRYGPGSLLRSVRQWQPSTPAAAETKRRELGYFEKNQARMRYPDYLRQGLPIGSGAVEGACKHLVADRFKGAGMRWKDATAEPVLQLRAALLTRPNLDLRPYAGRQARAA
jgi:hypothetical protein